MHVKVIWAHVRTLMVVRVCACVRVCTCGCACLRGMFGNTIQRLRGQAYVDYVLILAQRND